MSNSWKASLQKVQPRAPIGNRYGNGEKPLYNSMTSRQIYQARLSAVPDKRIIKDLIKYFSEVEDCQNKSDIVSRLLLFNTNIQEMELENSNLNKQVSKCRQQLQFIRAQMKKFSLTVKEKDDSILILKGKLYEKDENFKDLNSKLNKIIQAIQNTPNNQCSFSIEDIPKVVIEQENQEQISLTIPDTPNEFSNKIGELEEQNQNLKDKVSKLEAQLILKSKQATTNEQPQVLLAKIHLLTFSNNELKIQLFNAKKQIQDLKQAANQQSKISESTLGSDELQQLRASIKSLQEVQQSKSTQCYILKEQLSKLKQSDQLSRSKLQQIKVVNDMVTQEYNKLQGLFSQNKYQNQMLMNQNLNLKSQNSSLVNDVHCLRRDVDMLKQHIRGLQMTRTMISPMFSSSNPVNQGNSELNNRVKDLQIKLSQAGLKNKQLQNKQQQMKINMEQFQHRHGNEIRTLRCKLSKYQEGYKDE